jgi:chromosome partitioning protein
MFQESSMAHVISIAQQKGGAGKTTVAAHLAVLLSEYGLRVVLMDVDPQQSLTQWFAIRAKMQQGKDMPLRLVTCDGAALQGEIAKARKDADFIIIDSPPHASEDARAAVRYADMVIIPMQPSPLDLWATQATIKLARQEKTPVKMVLNRMNPQAGLSQKMQQEMKDMSLSLFGNRVAFATALLTGRGVSELAPSSAATREMELFAGDILTHFGYDLEEVEEDMACA